MGPASYNNYSSPATATIQPALEELLRFSTLMLRSGGTAFRVRESLRILAARLGLEGISVQLSLNTIVASSWRQGEILTLVREVGPSGVNAQRLAMLSELTHDVSAPLSDQELSTKLTAIETQPHQYSILQTGAAVGVACGAFAALNGGMGLEVLSAGIGGWAGQSLRSLLLRRHWNQYAVTALCAVTASGLYCVLAVMLLRLGLGVPRHTVGFISSVLFLVPGFPLIAGLLDLLQHETTASLTRLAYASMHMLTAALGLSFVIAFVGFLTEPASQRDFSLPVLILMRAIASFVAGSGFAILFNCSPRNVLHVGLLSIVGNELRLALRDIDWGLPLATFVGAFAVGIMASLARSWIGVPRITLTVPGVIMMIPGLYAFDALVLFNQGEITAALRATVLFCFGVGAMAMGLAAARSMTQPEWIRE
ncbi:MAG: threonine/serine exporter family protein [Gemmatales bacterium]